MSREHHNSIGEFNTLQFTHLLLKEFTKDLDNFVNSSREHEAITSNEATYTIDLVNEMEGELNEIKNLLGH